mgnify:CR=1 FL=1
MKQVFPFRTIVVIALAALFFVVVVKLSPLSFLLGGRLEQTKKSDISEFVGSLQNAKPSSQGGIAPQPPREAIKQVEKFISGQTIKDTGIDYRLTVNFGKNKETYGLVVNAASNPFRWRIEFMDTKTNYQTIIINDGNTYYSCNSYQKICDKLLSLDELSLPIPFTNFLNAFLDPLQLKKFVNITPEITIKTIAGKTADCLKGKDDKGEVEICTDQESGIPLLIVVKRNLDEYSLEALKIDIAPLPANIFFPPHAQLHKPGLK